MPNYNRIMAGLIATMSILALFAWGKIFETVNADEVMIVQSPFVGTLTCYTDPGQKWQGFGKTTHYPKRGVYQFENKIRFNDGAHAVMNGSIQYEVPLDCTKLLDAHAHFGSAEALENQLVQRVVDKAIYMTGPLMSSTESYAEKRNSLIMFVDDQVNGGVYQTRQREIHETDPVTNQERRRTIVEIVTGDDGKLARQEEPPLVRFGVLVFNFSIKDMPYDQTVEKQIAEQQQARMRVQTSMLEAKRAEQDLYTTTQQGKATAEKAKWEQEAEKSRAVVVAQQNKEVAETDAQRQLEVAKLSALAAEQYKKEQTLKAEADSTYKREVMAADGQLKERLAAWVSVNEMYANAIKEYTGNWVPQIQMGNNGQNANPAQDLISMLMAQTAKNLTLDFTTPKK